MSIEVKQLPPQLHCTRCVGYSNIVEFLLALDLILVPRLYKATRADISILIGNNSK